MHNCATILAIKGGAIMQCIDEILDLNLRAFFKSRQKVSAIGLGIITNEIIKNYRKLPKLIEFYKLLELRDRVQDMLLENGIASNDTIILELNEYCTRKNIPYTEFCFTEITPKHVLYHNLVREVVLCTHWSLYYKNSLKKKIDITEEQLLHQFSCFIKDPKKQEISRLKKILSRIGNVVHAIKSNSFSREQIQKRLENLGKQTKRKKFLNQIAITSPFKSCLKCNRNMILTFDHVIPVSKLNNSTISHLNKDNPLNAQWLCQSCNSRKGNQIIDYRKPEHFLAILKVQRKLFHDCILKEFKEPEIAAFIAVYSIFYKETNSSVFLKIQQFKELKSVSSISYYKLKLQDILQANNMKLK